MRKMILSNSQERAYRYITENLENDRIILLHGSAGTGKTTLTKKISSFFKHLSTCAIAPTHKSKQVIEYMLNENKIIPTQVFTVASALNKIKEHSYIGSQLYTNSNVKKLSLFSFFIIDEVSMIEDSDLRLLITYFRSNNKMALIIGDSNQIPCPSAKYLVEDQHVEKADSFIFTNVNIKKIELTDIVRQSEESNIIKIATFIKDNLKDDLYLKDVEKYITYVDLSSIYSLFSSFYDSTSINSIKIISYTNQSVKTHNLEVRKFMNRTNKFVKNEMLMGYSNLGYPELIIENGRDYIVSELSITNNYSIFPYGELSGYLISLKDNYNTVSNNLFFIDVDENYNFMNALVLLAEKVNRVGSTKLDYANYMKIKNKVVFIDDIYKYNNKIYTDTTFKEKHPLLFTCINDIYDIITKKEFASPLFDKFNSIYPSVIEERLKDNKLIGNSEVFADKFKIINKDIYYGYAITAHKSQGSTYDNVIVDELDFQKIFNRMNYKYNKLELRIKEKNQLRYVAFTRAKECVFVPM